MSRHFLESKTMELLSFLKTLGIPFEQDVSLSKKTWIKTGGVCSVWIMPASVEQLIEVCRYLYTNDVKFDIVGQTSNIFFHSTYNPLVVVSTTKIIEYTIKNEIITCDCGCSVIKLAKDCLSKGYKGFFGLVGLPGTVASAVFNNAGCFDCAISSMLLSADVLLPDGTIQTIQKDDFLYSKRSSAFKRREREGVILSVKLKVEKAQNIEDEFKKAEETKNYRKNKQEGYLNNLGSVYGKRKYRGTLKNRLASLLAKMMVLLGISKARNRAQKMLLLKLYGYSDLDHYVSDRSINTYIWKDALAEANFERYKDFMRKVFKDLNLEIEERI